MTDKSIMGVNNNTQGYDQNSTTYWNNNSNPDINPNINPTNNQNFTQYPNIPQQQPIYSYYPNQPYPYPNNQIPQQLPWISSFLVTPTGSNGDIRWKLYT